MQESLNKLTAQAKGDHTNQLDKLKNIRAQHEESMVALSDINTRLDVFAQRKKEDYKKGAEDEAEIQERVDIVQAKIERLESQSKSNTEGVAETQKKLKTQQEISIYMEERMGNVIDRINGIE